ncbi:MAG: glycine cleavage system aminomethyltransferase GcvT [Bacteriovoracaceae bacterium]
MKKTALYPSHIDLGAKLAEFGGYKMPIQYSNLKQEVLAVRNSVGMFDVGHMGEFFIKGAEAIKFVDFLLTNDFSAAAVNKAVYSPLCREDGSVIDDLIAYKLAEDFVMLCVNAANIEKDWNWIVSKKEGFQVELTNKSEDYSLIAVQGPKSLAALKEAESALEDIPYYSLQIKENGQTPIIFARTGYTGEDGFEIFGPAAYVMGLWSKLLKSDVTPCGLGARDVLRLEVCFPLYGQEIDDQTTPLESGLKWTVKFSKPDFIGKAALEKSSPRFLNLKLVLDKGIPRKGYDVVDQDGNSVGKVTSGSLSVILEKGVAMARVEKAKYNSSLELFVNIRGKNYRAKRHKGPFVNGGHK